MRYSTKSSSSARKSKNTDGVFVSLVKPGANGGMPVTLSLTKQSSGMADANSSSTASGSEPRLKYISVPYASGAASHAESNGFCGSSSYTKTRSGALSGQQL